MSTDPFAVLGLPAGLDLSDDEVRAGWRRIAAAAAAYTTLRTVTGRREAYADLPARHPGLRRLRRGRPVVLSARVAVAAAVSLAAVLAAGRQPATYGVIAGALTWLIRTARRELAPSEATRT